MYRSGSLDTEAHFCQLKKQNDEMLDLIDKKKVIIVR